MDDTSLCPRIYSSMLVCLLWITLDECTKMKDSHTIMYILENTSYIYIYIYISENPNLCKHSSTGMVHAQELVPLGN